MALIICPECGHKVSDKADACPGCGIKTRDILNMINSGNTQSHNIVSSRLDEQQNSIGMSNDVAGNTTDSISGIKHANISGSMSSNATTGKEPKKKKNTPVILLISFFIALAACGTLFYFYNNAQKDKEQEDYTYAMTSSDPIVMQMYLARYADAPQEHRDSVNARMQLLTQEDNDWTNAVVSGSRNALMDYINNHPDSPHKGEALNKIDSIDFTIANRVKTIESYSTYLTQHPDGKYASQAQDFIDSKKATEVQPDELAMARQTCKHFFQAINSRSESKLIETITDLLPTFLNRTNVPYTDVILFMNKLYKDDITNMNWHILDDFVAEKVKTDEENVFNIKVKFSAEQILERTDPSKEKKGKYIIVAEITPEGKICKFGMKKQTTE